MSKKKSYARTFGQDLMRGEHTVKTGGDMNKKKETASLKGGLTWGVTNDPYRQKGKSGGADGGKGAIAGAKVGGGKNAFMFKTDKGYKSGTDLNESKQTSTLKGGLVLGTTIHPFDNQEGGDASATGTSIFDPVLCELSYRWFSPRGGLVLDPFAGGSVRGIVASKMGRRYIGIDLQARQLEANLLQAEKICTGKGEHMPDWRCGDSRNIAKMVTEKADFILSCPPYADLEVYSDDPQDLSNLGYAEFRKVYTEIIRATCSLLKVNRFAVFVVGDVRDKGGMYYGFPWHTIAAFEEAGLRLYNEAVLVTSVGSLPVRATRQFEAGRKLGKALRNGTPVLTPAGWRPIETIAEHDTVVTADGSHTSVTGVFPQGIRDLWSVVFGDGSFVDADASHLWQLESPKEVVTTAEMLRRATNPRNPWMRVPPAAAGFKTRSDRSIVSISAAPPGLATCIAVDHPSSLFVVKDFIVTHNTHQNILCFVKGDPKLATAACGALE